MLAHKIKIIEQLDKVKIGKQLAEEFYVETLTVI